MAEETWASNVHNYYGTDMEHTSSRVYPKFCVKIGYSLLRHQLFKLNIKPIKGKFPIAKRHGPALADIQ